MTIWEIGVESVVTPKDPLPEMPDIPAGDLLVLTGRAPIWRYGRALHRAHGSPAGAVAVFDPRLGGGVVVMSHHPDFQEGMVVPVEV